LEDRREKDGGAKRKEEKNDVMQSNKFVFTIITGICLFKIKSIMFSCLEMADSDTQPLLLNSLNSLHSELITMHCMYTVNDLINIMYRVTWAIRSEWFYNYRFSDWILHSEWFDHYTLCDLINVHLYSQWCHHYKVSDLNPNTASNCFTIYSLLLDHILHSELKLIYTINERFDRSWIIQPLIREVF